MENATTLPIRAAASGSSATSFQFYRSSAALQIGLAWFALAVLWLFFAPEPSTTFDFCLVLGNVEAACFLAVAAWLISSQLSFLFKFGAILATLAVLGLAGYDATRQFDLTSRALEPASVSGGRINHRTLGVSYMQIPDCKIDLNPIVTQRVASQAGNWRLTERRLQYRELAVISQMTRYPRSRNASTPPWSIILEIQRNGTNDSNNFISSIRSIEATFAKTPNTKILQPTHELKSGRLNMLEFVAVNVAQGMVSRRIYLKNGDFVLNFMLNTEAESNHQLFNEFIESIKVEPPTGAFGFPQSRRQSLSTP